ncbi:MAG: prepilin-type N-terminal cleavage/methylation domain-containing protein [Candidatus Hydrogenedentes bacterium]|nr:prepilin-type N-terminal cleavage/methylation domain-containing protein [Candidatus Hydrogenedentota bacterium]
MIFHGKGLYLIAAKGTVPCRQSAPRTGRTFFNGKGLYPIALYPNPDPDPFTNQAGFTLVEMLVAMSIFLVLISGLLVLFNGVVETVREGYQTMDTFELGRGAINVIDRDLKGAFTSREHGNAYQFYGTPDGFMFVGTLESGEIGRVTYVLHRPNPGASRDTFQTLYYEDYAVVLDTIMRQARSAVTGCFDTPAEAKAARDAAAQAAANAFSAVYPSTPDDGFPVTMLTYDLVRYEEPGRGDLDTFSLANGGVLLPDGTRSSLQFPTIDPADPGLDELFLLPPPEESGPQQEVNNFVLSAINRDPSTLNLDIRTYMENIADDPARFDYGSLQIVSPALVESIVATRKREFWIRWLSGELFEGPPPRITPFWTFDGDENRDNADKPNVDKYIVSPYVIAKAVLLDLSGNPMFIPGGPAMNILFQDHYFRYSDGINIDARYFNALENLDQGIPVLDGSEAEIYYSTFLCQSSENNLFYWDNFLMNKQYAENRDSDVLSGSPLFPRLPAVVTANLTLTRPPKRPGGALFQRRFEQGIDVPSAIGRDLPATLAPSPGQV